MTTRTTNTFNVSGGGINVAIVLNPDLEEEINGSEEMQRTLDDLIRMATEYAINIAPVRDGVLVGTIEGEVLNTGTERIEGRVNVGTSYWQFVEYGTGIRGSASEQVPPGLPAGYQHGQVAGQASQPFMRLTLWWLREQIGF